MEEHIVKINSIEQVTHDVRRFRVEKPDGYTFVPGQATEVSINTAELKNEKRPFTFTCLNSDNFLEFTIKIYPSHNGITKELGKLKPGDEIIIRDVWGAISYKGQGIFIAGGAGVTPFISIFRDLQSRNELRGNLLLFANKTRADIILEKEFTKMLGNDFINILSEEKTEGYSYGYITEDLLKEKIAGFNHRFYVCGPPPMIDAILKQLANMGVVNTAITIEI
jgi:ferredoxin-NADP reductase